MDTSAALNPPQGLDVSDSQRPAVDVGPTLTILHADERLVVKKHSNGSNILFITFWGNYTVKNPLKDITSAMINTEGYAQPFVLKAGFDLVSVILPRYVGYQDLTRHELHSILKDEFLRYDKIYMYGSSGGGYAALYYSIGTPAIPIVYSPRVTSDPITHTRTFTARLRKENRAPREMVHEFLSVHSSTSPAYVIYDPLESRDAIYLKRRIEPCFHNVQITPVRFMGHGPYMLGEMGEIKNLVLSIVNSGRVSLSLQGRKRSKVYHYYLASYLFMKRKNRRATAVCLRALRFPESKPTYKDKLDIYHLLMKSLEKAGDGSLMAAIQGEFLHQEWFNRKDNQFRTVPRDPKVPS